MSQSFIQKQIYCFFFDLNDLWGFFVGSLIPDIDITDLVIADLVITDLVVADLKIRKSRLNESADLASL